MSVTYEIDGETWGVYLGEDRPHPDVLPLIFHCTTNSSHGWKVVEVPASEWESEDRVSRLSESELAELFERAQPFDVTHDPKTEENSVGETPLR
jgi:hypothetical protein